MRATTLWAAAAVAAVLGTACGYADPTPQNQPVAAVPTTGPTATPGHDSFTEGNGKTPVKFPDGLQQIDLTVGSGEVVRPGATVMTQYTGWLSDGTEFDSSWDRNSGTPLCAILSNSQTTSGNCTTVIAGWTEGVPGMRVGGRRKLTIPASLGYGSQGVSGVIPANATLVFTIQVVSVSAEPTPTPSASPSPSPSPTK